MAFHSEIAAIRLGYGLSALSVPPDGLAGFLASVDSAAPDRHAVTLDQVQALQLDIEQDLKAKNRGAGASIDNLLRQKRNHARTLGRQEIQRRIARAVDDPAGFGERLVQFWSDHFTVAGGNPFQRLMAVAMENEAIRPNLNGRFADMMFAAETHPRMLIYLDQARSFGPNSKIALRRPDRDLGLNENLAREMIELHSLGVGADYSQTDVRQLARLLTGLTFSTNSDQRFRPGMAEPGAETVLGRRYGGDGPAKLSDIRAVIEDLAAHEDTARHLARKLAVHFVSDDPPQSLLDRLAGIYRETGGDLSAMNVALAEAPELETHFRQKLRQPYDFVIAALRGLGVDGARIAGLPRREANAGLIRPLKEMGQEWGMPRGPDGWPEEAESWATPQGLTTRVDWAMRQPRALLPQLPDPRDFLRTALGGTASEALRWAVPKAESASEGLAIVLASADFNRR